MSSNQKLNKRFMILGLDNSGKSSITLSLKKATNLLSFLSLKPTKGLDVIDFSEDYDEGTYVIWDFGGQEQYHEDNLKRIQNYASESSKIIYVIDVQDQKRYSQALKYLFKVIEVLYSDESKMSISIFFHKYDPNIKNDYPNIEETVKTELYEKIQEKIPKNWRCDYFKTTIYTVFEKTSYLQ